jgi:anti-sigma factor RsiW
MAEPIHGNVASFVAGALEPEEDAAFAEHLPTCPSCRAEIVLLSELSAAVGQLTASSSPFPPDFLM